MTRKIDSRGSDHPPSNKRLGISQAGHAVGGADTWEVTDPVLSGSEHTATLLGDRGALVVGGNVGPVSGYESSSAEIYALELPPASLAVQAPAPVPPSFRQGQR